ncbi:hypothetical protein B597_017095 [Stutzerimonas stutzeri KOS6]|uniref:Uncharacterized protein n=1 Tax=Stutzerimonas stutzeri KOS6 TaxID=1218352 RepID=A0A061JKC0_STUST|nr:hypothetical protein B597_017095 [Stutzerimonas stutzeri KOS6]
MFLGRTFKVGTFVLLKLLQFLLEHLINQRRLFPPWLALGFTLGGISGYFAAVNICKALCLALKFGA